MHEWQGELSAMATERFRRSFAVDVRGIFVWHFDLVVALSCTLPAPTSLGARVMLVIRPMTPIALRRPTTSSKDSCSR